MGKEESKQVAPEEEHVQQTEEPQTRTEQITTKATKNEPLRVQEDDRREPEPNKSDEAREDSHKPEDQSSAPTNPSSTSGEDTTEGPEHTPVDKTSGVSPTAQTSVDTEAEEPKRSTDERERTEATINETENQASIPNAVSDEKQAPEPNGNKDGAEDQQISSEPPTEQPELPREDTNQSQGIVQISEKEESQNVSCVQKRTENDVSNGSNVSNKRHVQQPAGHESVDPEEPPVPHAGDECPVSHAAQEDGESATIKGETMEGTTASVDEPDNGSKFQKGIDSIKGESTNTLTDETIHTDKALTVEAQTESPEASPMPNEEPGNNDPVEALNSPESTVSLDTSEKLDVEGEKQPEIAPADVKTTQNEETEAVHKCDEGSDSEVKQTSPADSAIVDESELSTTAESEKEAVKEESVTTLLNDKESNERTSEDKASKNEIPGTGAVANVQPASAPDAKEAKDLQGEQASLSEEVETVPAAARMAQSEEEDNIVQSGEGSGGQEAGTLPPESEFADEVKISETTESAREEVKEEVIVPDNATFLFDEKPNERTSQETPRENEMPAADVQPASIPEVSENTSIEQKDDIVSSLTEAAEVSNEAPAGSGQEASLTCRDEKAESSPQDPAEATASTQESESEHTQIREGKALLSGNADLPSAEETVDPTNEESLHQEATKTESSRPENATTASAKDTNKENESVAEEKTSSLETDPGHVRIDAKGEENTTSSDNAEAVPVTIEDPNEGREAESCSACDSGTTQPEVPATDEAADADVISHIVPDKTQEQPIEPSPVEEVQKPVDTAVNSAEEGVVGDELPSERANVAQASEDATEEKMESAELDEKQTAVVASVSETVATAASGRGAVAPDSESRQTDTDDQQDLISRADRDVHSENEGTTAVGQEATKEPDSPAEYGTRDKSPSSPSEKSGETTTSREDTLAIGDPQNVTNGSENTASPCVESSIQDANSLAMPPENQSADVPALVGDESSSNHAELLQAVQGLRADVNLRLDNLIKMLESGN